MWFTSLCQDVADKIEWKSHETVADRSPWTQGGHSEQYHREGDRRKHNEHTKE